MKYDIEMIEISILHFNMILSISRLGVLSLSILSPGVPLASKQSVIIPKNINMAGITAGLSGVSHRAQLLCSPIVA